MKLVKLDIWRVALPFDAGRDAAAEQGGAAYNAASRQLTRMETLLVRLTTDDGREGWGEGFGHLVNPVTFAALQGPVGRFFLGQSLQADPASLAPLREAAERALHPFGRTGPVTYALSAIDIALWDLCAQASAQPLHRLLGSRRSQIEVYASLVSYDNDPAQVAQAVRRAAADGFSRIKLHETEPAAIRAARAALPLPAELMVDVNCPWSPMQAAAVIDQLQDLQLGWIEEPVWPPDDIEALAALRAHGVPIAAGENVSGVRGFEQHFRRGALDVAQPSVAKIGGISAMREVFALADAAGVRVMPHCFYYGAGLLATAHLVASRPAGAALEIPYLTWPQPLYPELQLGARLELPERPGLGFLPDMALIERHQLAHACLVQEA